MEAPQESSWSIRLGKYREDLLKIAIIGVPVGLLQWAVSGAVDGLTAQPWQGLFVLVPLAVLAGILWRRAVKPEALLLDGRMLAFLAVYVLTFVVASNSRMLDWQRTLVGYDDVRPRSPLRLNGLGDWRYWLVERERADGLGVVLMDSAGIETRRADLARLLGIATRLDVRGIALDFYFEGPSPIDGALCRAVERTLADASIPVFSGFGVRRTDAGPERILYPDGLEQCFPPERQAHLLVFEEQDGRVRSLPLHFRGEASLDLPALSLRAAGFLTGDSVQVPEDGLLRFVRPRGVPVLRFDEISERAGVLQNRFLIVGEDSSRDRFDTPDGEVRGVLLHTAALHSLQTGSFIEPAPGWISVVVLLLSCYGMLVLTRAGGSAGALTWLALALSGAALGIAALAISLWRVWIDTAYLFGGMWIFLLLLLSVRTRISRPSHSESD